MNLDKVCLEPVENDDENEFRQPEISEEKEENEVERLRQSKKAFMYGMASLIINVVATVLLILGYLTPMTIPFPFMLILFCMGLLSAIIGFSKNLELIKRPLNLWGLIISVISLLCSLNLLGAVYFIFANHIWSGLFR